MKSVAVMVAATPLCVKEEDKNHRDEASTPRSSKLISFSILLLDPLPRKEGNSLPKFFSPKTEKEEPVAGGCWQSVTLYTAMAVLRP